MRTRIAQLSSEKLKGDAQRQFELGGFSQYNAADDKAKKAISRATDIETTLKDTENLLREGSTSAQCAEVDLSRKKKAFAQIYSYTATLGYNEEAYSLDAYASDGSSPHLFFTQTK